MKTFTAALVFVMMVFIGGRMVGQNLVGNGSFEEHDSCPSYAGEISKAIGWSGFRNTPDYLNSCGGSQVWVPYNLAGHQEAKSGSAYAGFQAFKVGGYREMLGCELLSPLVIGSTYYIHFYVCAGLGGYVQTGVAANKIGGKFTTVQFSLNNPIAVDNSAHFYTNTIITDTVNWTEFFTDFVADSMYQYVVFGNFFDNTNTDTINLINGGYTSYYYIDDICISIDSTCEFPTTIEALSPQPTFSLSPNPFTTHLQLHYMLTQPGELMVYDALGRKVKSYTLAANLRRSPSDKETFELSVAELPAGVYLVAVESGGRVWGEMVVKE